MIESDAMSGGQAVANSAEKIDLRYDEGYFHGQGSGYGSDGYEAEHADWTELIEWVKSSYSEPIHWLDVGCAYGYLVEQAQLSDVEAFGVDISSFAVRQIEGVRDRLVRGLADELPFLKDAFDVVSSFDLVEHLENPNAMMEAVESVLKPDGLFFLSTPDPVYFQREEPTHIHEHPPSCWVDWLKGRGWHVEIRFGGRPYELEIIACRKESELWEVLKEEFQAQRSQLADHIWCKGEEYLCAVRTPGATTTIERDTGIYILNASADPQQFAISMITTDEDHPHLYIGDLKLRYLDKQTVERGTLHRWDAAPIPPGGRDVNVRVDADPIELVELTIETHEMDRTRFLEELSFDHYQRYRGVQSILNQIGHESLTVLDVGGALGYLNLFVPQHRIVILDRSWQDWPGALQYSGSTIPFDDNTFDVVVAVDTLEHIPSKDRPAFLAELGRVAKKAVLVCGPFNEPNVAETEAALRDFLHHHLKRRDRFLEEHANYTLPDRNETTYHLRHWGFATVEFENGYLPRWLAMQMASFVMGSAPELAEGLRRLNSLYNRHYYDADNQAPCYRMILAAFSEEIPGSVHAMQTRFGGRDHGSSMWPVADLIASLSMLGVLREKDAFLANQGERLGRFLDHLKNLETSLQEERKHASNLEGFLEEHNQRLESLQKHGKNLERLLEEQKKERDNLQLLLERSLERNEDVSKHGINLEVLLQSMQEHAANLEGMLKENQKHSRNLEALVKHQDCLLRETLTRLKLKPESAFADNIPLVESNVLGLRNDVRNLESEKRHLLHVNKDLTETLQSIYKTRFYRLMRKLGWSPTGKEPKDG